MHLLRHRQSFSILILVLVGAILASVLPYGRAWAYPDARDCSGGNAVILSPASGATVFGIVQIEGTASLGGDFQYYKLEVAPSGTDGYGDVSGQVRQQVVNGQLGVWDSASVPDGSYTFRLRVVDPTGNYCEGTITNVKVQNATPPTPTVVVTPTPPETEAPPVQVAIPTQAPTVEGTPITGTPGPSPTPTRAAPTRTPAPGSDSTGFGGIQLGTIVQAITDFMTYLLRLFVFGVLTMAALLLLIGVIYFVRRVL